MKLERILASAVLVLPVACGDGSATTSGATMVGELGCDSAACGGDPVGEWEIAGACIDAELDFASDDCPGATGSISGFQFAGSITFADDGTGTNNVMSDITIRANFPGECLMGASCEALEGALRGDDEDMNAVSCSGSSSCSCTARLVSDEATAFTWSTSGNTITIDGQSSDYCVQGDTAVVRTDTGEGTVSVLLARQ
jgi:hypothetical protein